MIYNMGTVKKEGDNMIKTTETVNELLDFSTDIVNGIIGTENKEYNTKMALAFAGVLDYYGSNFIEEIVKAVKMEIRDTKKDDFKSLITSLNSKINSVNNGKVYSNGLFYERTGVSLTNTFGSKFTKIEEELNSLQTEDIIERLKQLGRYNVDNQELSKLINEIKNDDNNTIVSNEVENLYSNSAFRRNINNARMSGNVNVLNRYNELFTQIENIITNKSSNKEYVKQF